MEPNWNRLDEHVKFYLPVVVAVALVSILITGLITAPVRRVKGYSPVQPVSFSHQLHAGQMRIDCRHCHLGVEVSRHATVPTTAICMNCHKAAATDKPGVIRLREAAARGETLLWKRVHKLPDFVYFAHLVHVQAGIRCDNCHGDVRRMDVMTQVSTLSMGACLGCHRQAHERVPGSQANLTGPENCSACHR
ncbi:MAG: cytochrome C [Acidobacteria bacterium]|nr:MAG: cytochrome C [Acidobacteriota bacterium]